MSSAARQPNRLIHETSPYLLQHAHNPVDWYPWGPDALSRAKAEDKPILLSIGYAACHWCHVMERESFENDGVARVLNDLFVSIKVDREERPDVDRVYMTFVQATTGSGGWPMSVWLTPELQPFFGGTYFPPSTQWGRPGFVDVLTEIGREAGLPPSAIAGGLAEPEGLPMRMQLERWGEITALVDCYNANPDSVVSAAATLAALSGVRRRIAVLGEMLELGPRSAALHEEVGRSLAGLVDRVVTVGGAASAIARGAADAGLDSLRADRDEAVRWLVENLAPGDAVLFKASRGAALEEIVTQVREACVNGVGATGGGR